MPEQEESQGSHSYHQVLRDTNAELAKYWPGFHKGVVAPLPAEPAPAPSTPQATAEKATGVKAGCIPCSLGHIGVCSSLLQEAIRFARSDGLDSDIPIDRINTCLDELNGLERNA